MNSASASELTCQHSCCTTGGRGATSSRIVGAEAQAKPGGVELGVEHVVRLHVHAAEVRLAQWPAAARRHPDVGVEGAGTAVEWRQGDEAAREMSSTVFSSASTIHSA
jgi:hypothetical protein